MDEYSFEIVFRNHYSKAYYLALRILHDDEASKDVVSDAFELVLKILLARLSEKMVVLLALIELREHLIFSAAYWYTIPLFPLK